MIKVTRRTFLKSTAATGAVLAFSGGMNALRPAKAEAAESDTIAWTPTTCVGCTTWCPVEVKTQTDAATGITRAVDVRGNRNAKRGDATNGDFSNVCPRARIAIQEAYDPDRVKTPMMRMNPTKGKYVDPEFVPISWEDATAAMAGKMMDMRNAGNSHKLTYLRGRYTYSRKTLYSVLPAIYGTPNAISHSSICAEAENFARTCCVGRWGYDDYNLDECRYAILWGVDAVSSNRQVAGTISKLGKRMNAGMTVVSVDPRLNATGSKANKWLAPRPGTDGALALAMAHHILVSGLWNKAFVGDFSDATNHFVAAADSSTWGAVTFNELGTKGLVTWWDKTLKDCTPSWAATITGVSAAAIKEVAEGFAAGSDTEGGDPMLNKANAISWLGPGVAMQPNGAYSAWACIALNGLIGSFDHKGGEIQSEPSNSWYTDGIPLAASVADGGGNGSDKLTAASAPAYIDATATTGQGKTKITKYEPTGKITAFSADGTDGNLKKQGTTPTNVTADAIIYGNTTPTATQYEVKFIIAAMANFPFSCTGASRWETALSGDMTNWSATTIDTATDGAPPFVVDISTHASELGMFADIILPGKHVGLEALGSTHQRSGMYKTHTLYNDVIDPVWPDAKNAETEVPWLIAEALAAEGFTTLLDYYASEYHGITGDAAPTNAREFELIATKYHATTASTIGGKATRTLQWDALNGPYTELTAGVLWAGNGISQATYSGSEFSSGRGKAWRYATGDNTIATRTDGVVAAGSTDTIIQSSTDLGTNNYYKSYIVMTSGACAGQARWIKLNTATAITVGEKFSAAPADTDTFHIVKYLFTTYSGKVEFYNDKAMLKYALDNAKSTHTWRWLLQQTNYNDTALLIDPLVDADTTPEFALMPHLDASYLNDATKSGDSATYPYTFIDHKSRLNREGRSANTPLYHEFKSCDAGDEKWKDVIKINPIDAKNISGGLNDGDTVRITSPVNPTTGITCKVKIWSGVRAGTVAKAYGQGHWAYGRTAAKRFGEEANGGNNNEILPGQWERLSGANVRNACIRVNITKVS